MGSRHIGWAVLPGLVILAMHPTRWLAETWFDEGYASFGEWIFLVVVGIAVSGATSLRTEPPMAPPRHWLSSPKRRALLLLGSTAVVRALAELLAVNTLGAVALAVDVYAIALGLELHRRQRPVSPIGLAALFALCLPLERLVQRGLGHPLQLISAQLACALLRLFSAEVSCQGTLISAGPRLLSVDLPCSGAQGLVLLFALVFAFTAVGRLRGLRSLGGLLAAAIGGIAGNAFRLVVLAVALRADLAAEAEPLHSLIGLLTLALSAAPVLALLQPPLPTGPVARSLSASTAKISPKVLLAAGLLSTGLALAILAVPARPIDVSSPVAPLSLPHHLGPYLGTPVTLSPKEARYFARYGGAAAKLQYAGPVSLHTVVMVQTRSPLRHLHGPDECLIGAGHQVRLVGVRHLDSTAVFRSQAPTGEVYRVEVTYFASDGRRAVTAAEVIWSALTRPGATWTLVERISPWDQCASNPALCSDFDRTLDRALDLEPARHPLVALNKEPSR